MRIDTYIASFNRRLAASFLGTELMAMLIGGALLRAVTLLMIILFCQHFTVFCFLNKFSA